MNDFANFPPAILLFLGALIVPFLKPAWRSFYVIALPLVALLLILQLEEGQSWQFSFLGFTSDPVEFLRVDKLSRAFGIIFSLNAFAAFLYAYYYKKRTHHVAALFYIGGALGTVFAGDLLSLYVFWESMAVSSTFLILSRNTEAAKGAAFRYIMIHLVGGLLLLAGIILTIVQQEGSIAFNGFDFASQNHAGTWLILLGILVNCGAPPLSAWLPDSYPSASVTGGLILSAYTTKTAVYTLLRGYPGWDPLIYIGCAMAIYGVVYALMESDMRRILAFAIINQVGFMVCAAGIGNEEAINGATAAAFCHILYKSLLWMVTGAVLYRVGKSNLSELGGMRHSMPVTTLFCCIGALSMAAPGTCGFTSKTMIIHAAEYKKEFFAWIILELCSVGIFIAAALRMPYFLFFGKDRGIRVKEAPKTMIAAMSFLAFLCLLFGVYPQPLYDLLPHGVDFNAYKLAHLTIVLQWLVFAGIAFAIFRKRLEPQAGRLVDFDWFYRKGSKSLYAAADRSLNAINAASARFFVGTIAKEVSHFFESGGARAACVLMTPVWMMQGLNEEEIEDRRQAFFRQSKRGAFQIGITAFFAVILLGMLSVIFLVER